MRTIATIIAAVTLISGTCLAGVFSSRTLVVYRVGDGSTNLLSSGSPVFLDEYTTNGVLVQSLAMPTNAATGNYPLIAGGTAPSEGFLSLSTNGRCLVLTGYGTNLGGAALSGTAAASVPRVVGVVGYDGSVDTTTALGDFSSGGNPRSAVTTDGTNLWVAGTSSGSSGGVRFTARGGTNSTRLLSAAVDNARQVGSFGGQMYVSSGSSSNRIGTVGSGMPVVLTVFQNLSGISTNTSKSPYAFFLADLNGDGTNDTAYVADDDSTSGGVLKYALVGDVWLACGVAGTAGDAYRGVTGYTTGSSVTLFVTRKGGSGSTGGGELAILTDSSGYNGTLSGSPSLLATAASKTAFRGVALAPSAPPSPPPRKGTMISVH